MAPLRNRELRNTIAAGAYIMKLAFLAQNLQVVHGLTGATALRNPVTWVTSDNLRA